MIITVKIKLLKNPNKQLQSFCRSLNRFHIKEIKPLFIWKKEKIKCQIYFKILTNLKIRNFNLLNFLFDNLINRNDLEIVYELIDQKDISETKKKFVSDIANPAGPGRNWGAINSKYYTKKINKKNCDPAFLKIKKEKIEITHYLLFKKNFYVKK